MKFVYKLQRKKNDPICSSIIAILNFFLALRNRGFRRKELEDTQTQWKILFFKILSIKKIFHTARFPDFLNRLFRFPG